MPGAPVTFFVVDPDDPSALIPQGVARSLWDSNQMHGVAISSALAREVERVVTELGRGDLRPARYTVDLFKKATMDPCHVDSVVVREGPRLCLVDAFFRQNDALVARAATLFLKPTATPDGKVWEPEHDLEPPSVEIAPPTDQPRVPFLWSESLGWSQDFRAHQNPERHRMWQTTPWVVPGEPRSPFVAAAGAADATSMVTNWGSNGVEFINTDITLTLSRLPVDTEVGLSASDRVENDGVAVGTATIFDRAGVIGTSVVTSVANARRTVDFSEVEYTDGGRKHAQPGA